MKKKIVSLNTPVLLILLLVGIVIVMRKCSSLSQNNPSTTSTSSTPPTSTFTHTATLTLPSPTPTLPEEIFKGTISQPTFCHNGPNESYLKAIPLPAGIRVDILAMNSDGGDWFMIRGLGIDPCWVEASMVNTEPNVDFQRVMILTTIITTENTPCREFPSLGRAIQTIIPKDRRIVSYGKDDTEAKWILVVPHNSTNLCWIENKYSTNFSSLPIESADFALEPTATNQPIVPVIPTKPLRSTATKDSRSPTNTPVPTNTLGGPSNTPIPTNTPGGPSNTPIPDNTEVPTSTPVPSNTPIPPTLTPVPPTPTPTLCWPPGHCK
jgi:hypothetical protein